METSLSLPFSFAAFAGIFLGLSLSLSSVGRVGGINTALGLIGTTLSLGSAWFFLALNPWIIDERFRTYRDFYYDLEEGMTRAEVLKSLDQHYPEEGERGRPTINQDNENQLGFFMNPEDQRELNCERIFLHFHDGKLASKRYSND